MKLTEFYKKTVIFLKVLNCLSQICKCCHYAYNNMNTEEYTGLSYWSLSPAHWCRSPERRGVCCVLGRLWRVKTGCWCRIRHSAGFQGPVQQWQRKSRHGRRVETDALVSAACSALQLYQLQQQHKQRQQRAFSWVLSGVPGTHRHSTSYPKRIPKLSQKKRKVADRHFS